MPIGIGHVPQSQIPNVTIVTEIWMSAGNSSMVIGLSFTCLCISDDGTWCKMPNDFFFCEALGLGFIKNC